MAAPTFALAESNGAGQTVSVVTTLAYASVDAASSSTLSSSNPVAQGANAFEKWWRLQLLTLPTTTISALTVYFSGTAPLDSASSATTITRYYGVNGTFATPVATTSTVAATNCSTNTSGGVALTTIPQTANAYSSYVTMQARVGATAAGGPGTFSATEVTFQYTWS